MEQRGKERKAGGGKKGYEESHKNINKAFDNVVRNHTAGSPMNEEIKWTNLTPAKIAEKITKEEEIPTSKTVAQKLLKKHGFRRRQMQKSKAMGVSKDRNEQFENIAILRACYEESENPIVSWDTKKKEMLGNLYRAGKLLTTEPIKVFDHDFKSFSDGTVIPHGIYDVKQNTGYINLGFSKDTSEFSCDCFRAWWHNIGKSLYPKATSILVLCDSGGSNNANFYLFKKDLMVLATELGITFRIAHYPPYTSKYNPIEHRMFPHVTRACQGVVFESVELVQSLMKNTSTKTGLSVEVNIIDKIYEKGRTVSNEFKKSIQKRENCQIEFHDKLPKLNYSVSPSNLRVI